MPSRRCTDQLPAFQLGELLPEVGLASVEGAESWSSLAVSRVALCPVPASGSLSLDTHTCTHSGTQLLGTDVSICCVPWRSCLVSGPSSSFSCPSSVWSFFHPQITCVCSTVLPFGKEVGCCPPSRPLQLGLQGSPGRSFLEDWTCGEGPHHPSPIEGGQGWRGAARGLSPAALPSCSGLGLCWAWGASPSGKPGTSRAAPGPGLQPCSSPGRGACRVSKYFSSGCKSNTLRIVNRLECRVNVCLEKAPL